MAPLCKNLYFFEAQFYPLGLKTVEIAVYYPRAVGTHIIL